MIKKYRECILLKAVNSLQIIESYMKLILNSYVNDLSLFTINRLELGGIGGLEISSYNK